MTRKLLARILLLAGVIVLLALFAWEAMGEELSVVEVRSNIPLSEHEPVYRDYYINSGSNQGLKHNLVVKAVRKITVKDATGTQTYGEMMVPVGQLKIIMVGEKFAVARELKSISRDEQPMLEQTGIMIGDKVELAGSFVDNHKIPRQKTAEEAQVKAPVAEAVKPAETAKPVAPAVKPEATPAAAQALPAPVALPEKSTQAVPEGEVEKTATAEENPSI